MSEAKEVQTMVEDSPGVESEVVESEAGSHEVALASRQNHAPAVAEQSNAVLDMIVRAATNPEVDVDKMERLMAMHDRIVARQAEAAFNDAMAQCQAEMRPISANARNPQTKSKYASYSALDNDCRPIYTKHGFSPSFDTGKGTPDDPVPENHVRVVCYLGHRDGHTRTYHADMPSDGKGAKGGDVMTKTHATGSAFTYGQRYMLKLIFNLAIDHDDDGNKAGNTAALISAEQKQRIIDRMKALEADTGAFLKYLKVPSLDELPASRFAHAMSALDKKEADMKKGAEK